MKLNGVSFFVCCRSVDGYYLAAAIPVDDIYETRLPFTLVTVLINIIFAAIMSVMVTFSTREEERLFKELATAQKDDPARPSFTVSMPGGKQAASTSASSRWSGQRIKWQALAP